MATNPFNQAQICTAEEAAKQEQIKRTLHFNFEWIEWRTISSDTYQLKKSKIEDE